mgnify:CR=1 FL=1
MTMKRKTDPVTAYRMFAELMMNDDKSGRRGSFRSVCRRIGVERKALESLLWQEMGMGGSALMRSFRMLHGEFTVLDSIKCFIGI